MPLHLVTTNFLCIILNRSLTFMILIVCIQNVSVRCAPRVSLGTMHTKEEPGTTSTDSAVAFDSGKEATSAPEFVMGTLHEALKFQYLTMHANPTQSPVGTEYSDDSKQDTINDVPVTESSNEAPFFAMNADFKLTDLELKAILLNKCIEEFQKDIPSYRLDALKTVDDVIAFFSEPAPLFARTGEKPGILDFFSHRRGRHMEWSELYIC